MGRDKYLADLREENNGWNPERIEDHPNLNLVIRRNGGAVVNNRDNCEFEEWTLSRAETEVEFIESWPRVFGLIIDGQFYYKAS